MNQLKQRYIGLLLLPLALSLCAQPVLIQPQNQNFGGAGLSNLRVRNLSADGSEAILVVDFSYDGINGPTARLLPVITDKKRPKVSGWFGAAPVTISTGRGTISLRVKFFNDDPGVPPELTTDHVKVLMLSDGGNILISQGLFARTIKWGNPNAKQVTAPPLQLSEQIQIKEKAETEAKVRAEARVKAEAEKARQIAEAQRLADEKAKAEAEAKVREEARLKAEAEEKARQVAEAQRLAAEKAKAAAEAKVREEARVKAEAEEKARQIAEAQRLADENAKAEAEAKVREEARLKAEAEEKARQIAEDQRLAEEKAKAAVLAPSVAKAVFTIAPNIKTKISNVDVVNRNLDRTEMTIAVEYQYAKADAMHTMGVDISSSEEPSASEFFSSPAMEIGRGSRGFVMFPVKLNAAAAQNFKRATLPTDKVWIYLLDANGAKSYVSQSTMILVWHIPGGGQKTAPAATVQNTVEIESFKQNDLFSGYVTVRYNLAGGSDGQLRLKVYDSANLATVGWFSSEAIPIKSGPGVQLVRIAVPKDAPSPDVFNVDTIEVEMLDERGAITGSVKKPTTMSWAKPK